MNQIDWDVYFVNENDKPLHETNLTVMPILPAVGERIVLGIGHNIVTYSVTDKLFIRGRRTIYITLTEV